MSKKRINFLGIFLCLLLFNFVECKTSTHKYFETENHKMIEITELLSEGNYSAIYCNNNIIGLKSKSIIKIVDSVYFRKQLENWKVELINCLQESKDSLGIIDININNVVKNAEYLYSYPLDDIKNMVNNFTSSVTGYYEEKFSLYIEFSLDNKGRLVGNISQSLLELGACEFGKKVDFSNNFKISNSPCLFNY